MPYNIKIIMHSYNATTIHYGLHAVSVTGNLLQVIKYGESHFNHALPKPCPF